MDTLFQVFGGVILVYWVYCMTMKEFTRPMMIQKNGGVVLAVAVVLLVSGFLM